MELAEWLRALNMQRYEAAFAEHDISLELLPSLTPEDFKDLGVASVGHRRRLLEAAAALRDAVVRVASEPALADNKFLAPGAERRPLSVMFCDLVGSTELASRQDPEDFNEIITTFRKRVQEQIAVSGGFIANYLGDGVLVYFGWPNSSETDTERAVLAALAIVDAVHHTKVLQERLSARVGLATGLVVVGEHGSNNLPNTVLGETPNLAARLQALAQSGEVVIDASTRHRVGELFEYKSLGAVALKGLPAPVPVWRVICARRLESRFEAMRGMRVFPLIGREEELDLLARRWLQAKSGEFQLVLLGGEPGIGKSRLVSSLREQLSTETHSELRYFCSPDHQENALYPIIVQWERTVGISREDTPGDKLRKLEAVLVPRRTSPEDIVLIATLLGIPTKDRYPPVTLGPQRRKTRTIEALIRQFLKATENQPVVVLVEDAHWADPSFIDLLNTIITTFTHRPVLTLITFRPEFKPPWVGQAGVSQIMLNRLTRRQAGQLVSHVAAESVLAPDLLDRVLDQSDGVPLFIEELVKAVLETGLGPQGAVASTIVPATLQSSLMTRLNRLPAAKKVAEIGAVIGPEFSHVLLGSIAQLTEAQLTRGLDELVAAGLVACRGVAPNATYTFKHALVLDAAYQFLLRTRRRELHLRVALHIQDQSPEVARSQPDTIAHHCLRAGRQAEAARWFIAAGDLALSRYAHVEARGQYGRALEALGRAPTTDDERRLLIDVTFKHSAVSLAASNPHEHLERLNGAEMTAQQLLSLPGSGAEDELRLMKLRFWLGRAYYHLSMFSEAMRYANGVLTCSAVLRDDELLGLSHLMVGRILAIQGRFGQAKGFLEQAIPILERQDNFAEYLFALGFLGLTEAARGNCAAGVQAVKRAEQVATELNFLTGIAYSRCFISGVHHQGGDSLGMLGAAQSTIAVAARSGDKVYEYIGWGMLAWAQAMQGDAETGLLSLERCREIHAGLGGRVILYDWFSAFLAEILLRLDRAQDAVQAAQEAIQEATNVQGIFAEGLARRTLAIGLVAMHAGHWEAAREQLQASLRAFVEGEALLEAARTHLTWALLECCHGCRQAAEAHFTDAARQFARSGLHDELRLAEQRFADCLGKRPELA